MKTLCLTMSIVFLLFLSSCQTLWVQIIKTGSTSCYPSGSEWVYENDSIRITYSFWDENGIMSFAIVNKLDVPIYIDWKKSSFISNGYKNDYWDNKETVTTTGVATAYGPTNKFTFAEGTSYTKIERKERIAFIPPTSGFYTYTYKITNGPYVGGTFYDTYQYGKATKYNLMRISDTFTVNSTPTKFRNFITYSTSEDFNTESYIDNLFYVENISECRAYSVHTHYVHYTESYSGYYSPRIQNGRWYYVIFIQ